MKITIKIIVSLFLSLSILYPSVCLSIENGNLYYTSDEDIYGFQFNHDGCAVGANGGDADVAGFSISVSSSTVLGFSFSGASIPAGSGLLMEDVECNEITELIFSGPADTDGNAQQLEANFLEQDCEGTCGGSVVEDCFGVCGGNAVIDECGVCDGSGIAEGACDCVGNTPEEGYNCAGQLDINETLLPNLVNITTYPNPFNPLCAINYSIPFYGHVKVSLFDIKGKELQVPINKMMPKGNHEIIIDGSNLYSGIYFVSISYNDEQITRKISLVK
tara:strand:- start:248 stop:1072 length:825 start_codon:yes stop_codon:yes gene_type:complete